MLLKIKSPLLCSNAILVLYKNDSAFKHEQ